MSVIDFNVNQLVKCLKKEYNNWFQKSLKYVYFTLHLNPDYVY